MRGHWIRRAAFVVIVFAGITGAGLMLRAEPPQAVGTWASIGTVSDARTSAASAVLSDGRTLIAGGALADGTSTDSIVIVDPASGSYVTAGHLSTPRRGHSATALNDGRVAIVGGTLDDNSASADIEIFDPATGTSTLAASLNAARTGHAATLLANGDVLVVGGAGADGGVLDDAVILTVSRMSATVTPVAMHMSTPRLRASATTLIDGRVLVAGGNNGTDDLASAEMFDPSSQMFSSVDTTLQVPRSGHTAILLPNNNGVLIAGGRSNGTPQDKADVFVPAEFPDPYSYGIGSFAPTASMTTPRSRAVMGTGLEGYVFVAGGGSSDAEQYRFATIKTDADDYAPGTKAVITGTGWQPGETVHLIFQEDPAVHDDYKLDVVADSEGKIYYDQWAPEQHDLNVRFYLTAKDSKSHAQITFTDGNAASVSGTVKGSDTNAGINGATVTCTSGCNSAASTTTDSLGNYAFSGATTKISFAGNGPTTITLTASKSGYNPASVTLNNVNNGDILQNVNLLLTPACTAATVTTPPGDQSITYGGNASFTAAASGNPTPTVQWEVSTNGGATWTPVPGATSTTLALNSPTVAQSGNRYHAVFTNQCGGTKTATTASATLTIGPKSLTASFTAQNKTYDGTNTAVIDTRSVTGNIGGDDVTISGGTATFADKNVGTGKTVTATGFTLIGTAAANYTLGSVASWTTQANITALSLTGSFTAQDKVYDATTSATISSRAIATKVGNDDVSLTGGSAAFADKNAGVGKTVTGTGFALTGVDAGNYTLAASTLIATASITARSVTGTFAATNKEYDGTTAATIVGRALTNAIPGDLVTLAGGTATFADKNVGVAKTVTGSGFTLSGADAGNYTLTSVATANADITPKSITGSFTAANKVYDGTTAATVLTQSLTGAISGDTVSLTGGTAAFGDKNVGVAKTVTLTGAALNGGDASNYSLSSVATATADITPKSITGSFTASNKVYDGTTAATIVTESLTGAISGDAVSLAGGTASFADKNVGVAKTVTVTGAALSGGDASNYTLASVGSATADITAKSISGSFTASDKVYDGTTAATIVTQSLTGAINGDAVSLAGGTASFADKNVGVAKTVTLTGAALSGGDASNYSLGSVATATADITPKSITGSFTTANKIYDGTTAATIVTQSLTGAISGDAVSLAGGTASFADKNVGVAQTVTLTGAALNGTDASNYTLTSVGSATADITAKSISGSFTASNKIYDGTTAATIVTQSLTGAISGDAVSLAGGTASFADKNVGVAKTVTLTGAALNGTDASNYSLANVATATADITPKALTIAGAKANDRTYNGGVVASVDFGAASLSGLIPGDDVGLNTSAYTAAFGNKNVGTDKPVTVNGVTLSGPAAANYTVSQPSGLSASITPSALHVTATGVSRIYNGTTAATVTLADDRVEGDLLSIAYTATFADKGVGSNKPITVSGISVTGVDAGNYVPNSSTTASANITPRPLAVSATGVDKVYDGTTTATVTLSDDRVTGDVLTLAYSTANFSDKNVGSGKTVSVNGISIGGADAPNYALTSTTTTATASINARPITITADAKSKQFGAADPSLTYQITSGNLAAGDSFSGSLTRDVGEDVGTYSIRQGSVTAGANYALTYIGASLTIGAWSAQGFYSPIAVGSSIIVAPKGAAPAPTSTTVWNTSKGGSTIPLKFDVFPNGLNAPESTNVADVFNVATAQLPTCTISAEDTLDYTDTSTLVSTLFYDGEQMHLNWKTPSVKQDTCYLVTATLKDKTTIHTFIKLKK